MSRRSSIVFLLLGLCALLAAGAGAQAGTARDAARPVVIGASGDLLLHIRLIEAAEGLEGGWDRVLGGLSTLTADDDISFANLETPLSVAIEPCTGSPPTLGAPPDAAAALARGGIDVLSVANNHAYDQRATGMADTVTALRAAGIASVGAGASDEAALEAWVSEVRGLRIAFLAVTERINGRPGVEPPLPITVARWDDDERVYGAIERARASADVVVVSIHWSHDFHTDPMPGQRRRAAAMIEHGADVILGHGPHVLQSVERLSSPRGDAVVAYSLGNLVSNQGMRHRVGRSPPPGAHIATTLGLTRDGAWLRVPVSRSGERIVIGQLEAVPLYTYNNYFERVAHREEIPDVRLATLAQSGDAALIADRRAAIGAALGPLVRLLD